MIGMPAHNTPVAKMSLTPGLAQSEIRKIAQKSENVILGNHARERMLEREIHDIDVFRILQGGRVDGRPELTEFNEWKCKVVLKIRGSRTAGVVVVMLRNGKLFVKTVEWENRL